MGNNYIYIGRKEQVRYNPKTQRLCPSDYLFVILTLVIIVAPSAMAYYLIADNEEIELWAIILLLIIYTISFYMCLRYLFLASWTEPGIIPKIEVQQNEYIVD